MTDNTFEEIGRVGALSFGGGVTAAIVTDNTYTGKGSGDWLDYGFELGGGAVGSLTNNVVTGCTGVASVGGSLSAGIMATDLYGTATAGTLTGSILEGNTIGLVVGYDGADETAGTARYNDYAETDEYGVLCSGLIVTDAMLNWWGDAAGPTLVVPPGPGDGPSPVSPSSFDAAWCRREDRPVCIWEARGTKAEPRRTSHPLSTTTRGSASWVARTS